MARKRIDNDFYPTPDRLINRYLDSVGNQYLKKTDTILEPCAGDGAISKPLIDRGFKVVTTDLTEGYDATEHSYWVHRNPDWVVSNPPFKAATKIIDRAIENAQKGVIMILRQSYLEPCRDRRHLLDNSIANITFVNPRPKFRSDTTNTDSSSVVFIVWTKQPQPLTINYLTDWHI